MASELASELAPGKLRIDNGQQSVHARVLSDQDILFTPVKLESISNPKRLFTCWKQRASLVVAWAAMHLPVLAQLGIGKTWEGYCAAAFGVNSQQRVCAAFRIPLQGKQR